MTTEQKIAEGIQLQEDAMNIINQLEQQTQSPINQLEEVYKRIYNMSKGAVDLSIQASLIHQNSCEQWNEGLPVKTWIDGKDRGMDSIVCIAYESGRWWHYKKADNGFAWW